MSDTIYIKWPFLNAEDTFKTDRLNFHEMFRWDDCGYFKSWEIPLML